MNSAKSRPLPPSPPARQTPTRSSDRSTGVRVKQPSTPTIEEAPEAPTPLAEGIRNNSVAPESLKKPFASLTPHSRKRADSDVNRGATPATRSQSPKEEASWDESTNLTASRRPARANCKKHGIAKGQDGQCMLCKKEEQTQDNGLGWKLLVALVVIAVISGGVIAAII